MILKKDLIHRDVLYLYCSFLCLVFMRYFEGHVWGTNGSDALLNVYEFVAIPLLYFCLSVPIASWLLKKFIQKLTFTAKKYLRYFIALMCFVFVLYVGVSIFGNNMVYHFAFQFQRAYAVVFCVLGVLFSFAR